MLPGWLPGGARLMRIRCFSTRASEICVEILSPSNTQPGIDEKRALYFDAGATEAWICNLDGSLSFFSGVDH